MTDKQTEAAKASGNMELWNMVKATDPKMVKPGDNNRYKFTTVDPHYQLFRATQLWGPYGDRWGIKDIDIRVIDCDPAPSWLMFGVFFYPNADEKSVSFQYAVDLKYHAGFDMGKRLITAFRSKCLSLLGFNADVFWGQFDDPEYVKASEVRFGDMEAIRKQTLASIRTAKDVSTLNSRAARVNIAVAGDTISPDLAIEFMEEIEKRRMELEKSSPSKKEKK